MKNLHTNDVQTIEQWFLTLLEVLDPASVISAFTGPFVIGKIKYDFFKTQVYILLVHKMNHASVAHKITVFKEQRATKHEFKKMVFFKIVFEFLTSAEPLRLTQRTPGVENH